jgi:uroporphyrinogen-III synthase
MTAILVTRPRGSAHPLVAELERLGYHVYEIPTVEVEPFPFDNLTLVGYDWVIVTSGYGVGRLPALPPGPRFAAVGMGTAQMLRERGVEAAFVPPKADARTLAETLPDVQGRRIALFQASAADGDLAVILRRRGAIVDEITGYRTVEAPAQSAEPLRAALDDPELAAVAFASGSAVRGFLALGGSARLPAITIGPRTTEVAREHGFDVVAESAQQTTEALAMTIARAVPVEEKRNA